MKKRWFVLAFLGVVAVAMSFLHAGEGVLLRCAGVNTTSGNDYLLIYDSLARVDSIAVDTFYSDTFKFEDYPSWEDFNYVVATLIRDTVLLCDSCNDSVVVTTTMWTRDGAGYAVQLATDAQAADLTNDTVNYRMYINSGGEGVPHKDSLVRDEVWFRTIITDSIVTDIYAVASPCTTKYKARYFLWFLK